MSILIKLAKCQDITHTQGILLTKRESLVFSATMEISYNQFHTPMGKCEFNGNFR